MNGEKPSFVPEEAKSFKVERPAKPIGPQVLAAAGMISAVLVGGARTEAMADSGSKVHGGAKETANLVHRDENEAKEFLKHERYGEQRFQLELAMKMHPENIKNEIDPDGKKITKFEGQLPPLNSGGLESFLSSPKVLEEFTQKMQEGESYRKELFEMMKSMPKKLKNEKLAKIMTEYVNVQGFVPDGPYEDNLGDMIGRAKSFIRAAYGEVLHDGEISEADQTDLNTMIEDMGRVADYSVKAYVERAYKDTDPKIDLATHDIVLEIHPGEEDGRHFETLEVHQVEKNLESK